MANEEFEFMAVANHDIGRVAKCCVDPRVRTLQLEIDLRAGSEHTFYTGTFECVTCSLHVQFAWKVDATKMINPAPPRDVCIAIGKRFKQFDPKDRTATRSFDGKPYGTEHDHAAAASLAEIRKADEREHVLAAAATDGILPNVPKYEKPPLGLRPRFIAAESRMEEIMLAMARYAATGHAVPTEWVGELSELIEFTLTQIGTKA